MAILELLKSSWAVQSRVPLENATLHSCWSVSDDALSPSISKAQAGTMQQNDHSVAPFGPDTGLSEGGNFVIPKAIHRQEAQVPRRGLSSRKFNLYGRNDSILCGTR